MNWARYNNWASKGQLSDFVLDFITFPSSRLLQFLDEVDRWGIDIFRIAELSSNRPLTAVTYAIFKVRTKRPG